MENSIFKYSCEIMGYKTLIWETISLEQSNPNEAMCGIAVAQAQILKHLMEEFWGDGYFQRKELFTSMAQSPRSYNLLTLTCVNDIAYLNPCWPEQGRGFEFIGQYCSKSALLWGLSCPPSASSPPCYTILQEGSRIHILLEIIFNRIWLESSQFIKHRKQDQEQRNYWQINFSFQYQHIITNSDFSINLIIFGESFTD